jgi:uncharacterized protein YjbJ (UPF0337 family)
MRVGLAARLHLQTETVVAKKERQRMDWHWVAGNWKQLTGRIKERWGKLTDDDLAVINGQRDQLEGKLQERYGYAKDQARREVEEWYNAQIDN